MAIVDRRGVVVSGTDPAEASDPNPGLAIKTATRAATTANIVLSGLQTLDAIALAEGDRVLVKDQVDQTQNGIYNASSGNWTRSTDADSNTELAPGLQVGVITGTLNGGKTFKLLTASPIVLGTSLIVWQVVTYPKSSIGFQFDGGGAAILPGQQSIVEVPFGCTIALCDFFANRSGSMVVDIQRTTKVAYPAGLASICAADRPTLAAAQKSLDSSLTGWTLILNEDDVLVGTVVSNDVVNNATVSLKVSRS